MSTQYIYIIREREFINSKEDVYKIGKTAQKNCKRTASYPKGSVVHCVLSVSNCELVEKILITEFTKRFKHRKDIGREYFEGNLTEMKKVVFSVLHEYEKMSHIDKNLLKVKYIKKTTTSSKKEKPTKEIKTVDPPTTYSCGFCKYETSDIGNYCQHLQSKKHENILKEVGKKLNPPFYFDCESESC